MDASIKLPDDLNYIKEMDEMTHARLRPEFISWNLIDFFGSIFGNSSSTLRLISLIVAIFSLIACNFGKNGGKTLTTLFVISISPLYYNLYFNQIRLAIAILIFLFTINIWQKRSILLAAVGGHFSFLFIGFPILIIFFALLLGDISAFNLYTNYSTILKVTSYAEIISNSPPIYFGWELAIIIFIYFISTKNIPWKMIIFLIMVVFISYNLNLAIGRRLLEIGIIAFSPLMLFLLKKRMPPPGLIAFYLFLAILEITKITLFLDF